MARPASAPPSLPSPLSLAALRAHFASKLRTPVSTAFALMCWALFFHLPSLVRPHWPAIVASLGGYWGCVWKGALGTNILVQVGLNALLLPVYWSGFLDAHRCDGSKPWPWASAEPEVRAQFWATLRSSLLLVGFNATVVAYAGTASAFPLAQWLGALGVGEAEFPSAARLAWDLLLCLLVEDAVFFTTHRLLHTPFLYRHVHSACARPTRRRRAGPPCLTPAATRHYPPPPPPRARRVAPRVRASDWAQLGARAPLRVRLGQPGARCCGAAAVPGALLHVVGLHRGAHRRVSG